VHAFGGSVDVLSCAISGGKQAVECPIRHTCKTENTLLSSPVRVPVDA
jgi:hypothetical protein